MNNKKLGQEPAFPVSDPNTALALLNTGVDPTGMSKRFYAACAGMQGMLARYGGNALRQDAIVKWSLQYADELLKQEQS